MTERYHPSRDQVTLAAVLGESLASLLPLSRLRESQEESAVTWKALRDLGVFGISTPEEQGGSGLGIAEEALIAIELGRRVVAPSVLATIGAARLPFAGERSADARRTPGRRRLSPRRSSRLRRRLRREPAPGPQRVRRGALRAS